jgi:hypothetical protein
MRRWVGVSALAGTISAPFAVGGGSIGASRWLRPVLSLLAAIGILAVALPAAFSSGATGAGVNPVEVFSTGSLVSVEAGGGARLSIAGMVPGEGRSATIRVANTGAEPATFSLAPHVVDRVGAGGARLSDALVLRIETPAGRTLYSGPIGRMPRLGLGGIAAGSERAYRFAVTLPGRVGNEVEGASLSAGLSWNAAA